MRYACVALLSLNSLSSWAGEADPSEIEGKFWDFNFYLENDLFANTDTNYTNGIRLAFSSTEFDRVDNELPNLLGRINRKLKSLHGLSSSPDKDSYSFVGTIGQRMYTPSNKLRQDVMEDERPYAGWLYIGLANHTLLQNETMITIELDLGMVGPASLAKQTQDFVHDSQNISRFQGWDNQLGNEFGIALIYEYKKKWQAFETSMGLGADIISHAGGSLGNVATYANAGIEARLGWNIPNDFGTSALRPAGDNSAPGPDERRKSGLHLFLSMDNRLVARDIFLDGNTFKASHSVDKKNWVADGALGISLNIAGLKLSYARIFRSKEYFGQVDPHSYGSLSVSFSRRF